VSSENSRKISHAAQNIESPSYNGDVILGGFSLIFRRGILARRTFERLTSNVMKVLHSAIETERNYGSLFLILVTCFGLGAAGYLALPFEPQTWVIPSLAITLLALAVLSFSQRGIISSATAVIIATLLGALAVQIEIARLDTSTVLAQQAFSILPPKLSRVRPFSTVAPHCFFASTGISTRLEPQSPCISAP
jgi:hypothetical protein